MQITFIKLRSLECTRSFTDLTDFDMEFRPFTVGTIVSEVISKTIIVIITVQRAAIIDHFHTLRREPEDGRPVPCEASYGGIGGVAWYGNPFELPNCEI